jgi:hypothetical protein
VGHLSFDDILDTSLKVSWQEPAAKNGILTGRHPGLPNWRVGWGKVTCHSDLQRTYAEEGLGTSVLQHILACAVRDPRCL